MLKTYNVIPFPVMLIAISYNYIIIEIVNKEKVL